MPRPVEPTPEQWAEARSLRAGGVSFERIARRVGIGTSVVTRRARKEDWPSPARVRASAAATRRDGASATAATAAAARASPGTASIRARLAVRLYSIVECKIRMMELRMIKELQAHERAQADADAPPPPVADERDSFAALIASINQVTEMVSEPAAAPAPVGRRKPSAGGAINPELTALSDDIDPDGLAAASEKDNFRREIAEHLGRMFSKP